MKSESKTNKEAGLFLAEYTASLLRSGATCIRMERNVQRMADKWGLKVALTIATRQVHVSVIDSHGRAETFTTDSGKTVLSYDVITRLSNLSWKVADSDITIGEAVRMVDRIQSTPPANKWWVLFAASCANAAFCRLFGGDALAMAVVFLATMAGFYLKQVMVAAHCDIRLTYIVCAFVSSVLAAAGFLFGLGNTPEVAMATSVLYLVPGIPFLNAFSDLADGQYICAFTRLTDALVLTACLSTGLCIGMKLMEVGMF